MIFRNMQICSIIILFNDCQHSNQMKRFHQLQLKRILSLVIPILILCSPLSVSGRSIQNPESQISNSQDSTTLPLTAGNKNPENTSTAAKQQYRKKGWSFAPFPALGYGSDLGLQLGAYLDVYYFGDGSTYPEYLHKITAEVCWFTKGSGIYYLFYDSKYLIKGLRVTASASYLPNTMMAFHGFNGYHSPYSKDMGDGFFAIDRNLLRIIADVSGEIDGHWRWSGGIGFYNYDTGRVKAKKIEDKKTLYDIYRKYGIIRDDELGNRTHLELRGGIVYDTRDNEPDPTRGIYADLLVYGSPDIFGRRGYDYLKAGVAFRHYVPIIPNRLTLAYRICWQGLIAGNQPFYVLQNYATIFPKQINSDILGGMISLRGILYNRVVGNSMAWGNAELRLRLFDFRLIGQEWYVSTNPFFDAGIVTQPFRADDIKDVYDNPTTPEDERRSLYSGSPERLHMSAGLGVKLVMNRNFILSGEYGIPFDRRDGNGGLYLGINYIF